jgi:hypothetical protein
MRPLAESRSWRIAIGLIAIAVMLGPAILSFSAGISTNLIWALVVIVIAGALACVAPRFRVICLVAGALALALPPMPMWLSVRNGASQIQWSQAAFEVLAFVAAGMLIRHRR